jgi:hypothetical protein
MKQFQSIEKLDTSILYALELASSISVLLLAFGLIASMANVQTKGSVLTDNLIMQRIWARTQCIAIGACCFCQLTLGTTSPPENKWTK